MTEDAKEPVFSAPWQARAFALGLSLQRRGVFSPREWAAALGRAIVALPGEPGDDPTTLYWRQWLAALEQLSAEKAALPAAEQAARLAALTTAEAKAEQTDEHDHEHGP
jgi:nitrile hydratase accessory protein